jgi:hypothetical protein
MLSGTMLGIMRNTAGARQPSHQTIEPEGTEEVLVNPGIGFETFHSFNGDERNTRLKYYPKCSIAYFRFYWDALEPRQGKYNFDVIDSLLDKGRQNNQDLALRIMPMSTTNARQGTPKWYMGKAKIHRFERRGSKGWAPDHNEPRFLAKQEELVGAFGERYNGHPNIIRMDIGSVGFWGEWHLSHTNPPVPMITRDNAIKVIDMYLKHWDRTPLSMLIGHVAGLRYAVGKGTGWRADSLGDYGHWSNTWCHMFNSYPQKLNEANALDAWKRGPVAFEPPGSMVDLDRYVPSRGGGYDKMWDQALKWGGSACNAKSGAIPSSQVESIKSFLKRCGYRLALRRLVVPRMFTTGDRQLPVTMEFENAGVSPPYRDYVLAIRLTGGAGPIVLHSQVKTSKWLPGRHKIEDVFVLPGPLGAGEYRLALGLLEPSDHKPAVRLANKDTDREGWYPVTTFKVI